MNYINKLLRKSGVEALKQEIPVEEEPIQPADDELSFNSTLSSPSKTQVDTDTTDYESADEGVDAGTLLNLTALADNLNSVHISTPKSIQPLVGFFPYSPPEKDLYIEFETDAVFSESSHDVSVASTVVANNPENSESICDSLVISLDNTFGSKSDNSILEAHEVQEDSFERFENVQKAEPVLCPLISKPDLSEEKQSSVQLELESNISITEEIVIADDIKSPKSGDCESLENRFPQPLETEDKDVKLENDPLEPTVNLHSDLEVTFRQKVVPDASHVLSLDSEEGFSTNTSVETPGNVELFFSDFEEAQTISVPDIIITASSPLIAGRNSFNQVTVRDSSLIHQEENITDAQIEIKENLGGADEIPKQPEEEEFKVYCDIKETSIAIHKEESFQEQSLDGKEISQKSDNDDAHLEIKEISVATDKEENLKEKSEDKEETTHLDSKEEFISDDILEKPTESVDTHVEIKEIAIHKEQSASISGKEIFQESEIKESHVLLESKEAHLEEIANAHFEIKEESISGIPQESEGKEEAQFEIKATDKEEISKEQLENKEEADKAHFEINEAPKTGEEFSGLLDGEIKEAFHKEEISAEQLENKEEADKAHFEIKEAPKTGEEFSSGLLNGDGEVKEAFHKEEISAEQLKNKEEADKAHFEIKEAPKTGEEFSSGLLNGDGEVKEAFHKEDISAEQLENKEEADKAHFEVKETSKISEEFSSGLLNGNGEVKETFHKEEISAEQLENKEEADKAHFEVKETSKTSEEFSSGLLNGDGEVKEAFHKEEISAEQLENKEVDKAQFEKEASKTDKELSSELLDISAISKGNFSDLSLETSFIPRPNDSWDISPITKDSIKFPLSNITARKNSAVETPKSCVVGSTVTNVTPIEDCVFKRPFDKAEEKISFKQALNDRQVLQPLFEQSKQWNCSLSAVEISFNSSTTTTDQSEFSSIASSSTREDSLEPVSDSLFSRTVNAMDKSYHGLQELYETCSKQERELGCTDVVEPVLFNISIAAEARRLADEISKMDLGNENLDDVKPPQCMMQSSLPAEINNSEAGPVTADEDFKKSDCFVNPNSVDFEYFFKSGNRKEPASNLTRNSLFLKFDPLVEGLVSAEGKLNDSNMSDHGPGEQTVVEIDTTPPRNPAPLVSLTPVNSEKRGSHTTPVSSKSQGSTPTLKQEFLSKELSKLQELMLQQETAHQELLVEKTDEVERLRKRVSELEAREPQHDLEERLKKRDLEIARLQKELTETNACNKQLVVVMEEYEKTITQLVTNKEDTKNEYERIKEEIAQERDTAVSHLNNMEVAFNDVHAKYERVKSVVETLHNNEKLLKESLDEHVKTIERQKENYEKLKSHAVDKLKGANQAIANLGTSHKLETAKMNAAAKKADLKIKTLEEALEQKRKEVNELTKICDELIGKVSMK